MKKIDDWLKYHDYEHWLYKENVGITETGKFKLWSKI